MRRELQEEAKREEEMKVSEGREEVNKRAEVGEEEEQVHERKEIF